MKHKVDTSKLTPEAKSNIDALYNSLYAKMSDLSIPDKDGDLWIEVRNAIKIAYKHYQTKPTESEDEMWLMVMDIILNIHHERSEEEDVIEVKSKFKIERR